MISKNDLNNLLIKYDYQNLIKGYVAVLINNPHLPFPQKEFEVMRNHLSETKDYENYVPLLRLRIRKGIDQKEDYHDPAIFKDNKIFFDKFHAALNYQDPIVQYCIDQAIVYFSTMVNPRDFSTQNVFAFWWSVAHLNISENEYYAFCQKSIFIMNLEESRSYRCDRFNDTLELIYLRFPKLVSQKLVELIQIHIRKPFHLSVPARYEHAYISLVSEDVSKYSLEQSKEYLTRLISQLIESGFTTMGIFDEIKKHRSILQVLEQFTNSTHWEDFYEHIIQLVIKKAYSFVEAQQESFFKTRPNRYLDVFKCLSVFFRIKGVPENKILSWEDQLLSGLRIRDAELTQNALNDINYHEGDLNKIEYALECMGLNYQPKEDYSSYNPKIHLVQKPNIFYQVPVQDQTYPAGLQMILLCTEEYDPDMMLQAYSKFEAKDLLYSNGYNLFYLLLLMGPDTFEVLRLYKDSTSELSLKTLLNEAKFEGSTIQQLKTVFQKNKTSILHEGKWKIFLSILVSLPKTVRPVNIHYLETLEDCYYCVSLGANDHTMALTQSLTDFKAKFIKVNNQVSDLDRYGRDFTDFLNEHAYALATIASFLGRDTFKILSHYLTTSVLPLERLLENIPRGNILALPILQLLYVKYKESISKNKIHEALFISLSFATTMNSLGLRNDAMEMIPQTHTLIEWNNAIAEKLIGNYHAVIGHQDEKIDYRKAFQNVPLPLFAQLVRVRNVLVNSQLAYLPVFDYLLCTDLSGKKLINNKATDLFKQLDVHNQNIHTQLKNAKIDVAMAFNYKELYEFSFGGANVAVDELQTIKALWIDMNQLLTRAREFSQTEVVKFIDDLQNSLLKKFENAQGAALNDNQAKEVFRKLKAISSDQKKSRLDTLISKLDRHIVAANDNILNEFFGHLKRESDTLRDLLLQPAQSSNTVSRKYFSIEMFDKSQPDTFALGTYVGCCLAPDGGQFGAMIQRRMDDAMFMHVVRDKATNKPVALNWLFFAKSKSNPQDIYVVANFFEIAASLGLTPAYRDQIIHELKEFTGRYTQAIGAKGFLMNQLSYGLIPDFTGYEQSNIRIEKVGGFLRLNGQVEDYYLNSLNSSRFHLFKTAQPTAGQSLVRFSSNSSRVDSAAPTTHKIDSNVNKIN